LIERRSERFTDALETVKGADTCQNMRRVGSLPATRFEQAALLEECQQRVQEALFQPTSQDTLAKVTEQAEIEARIG
jgi:hypothetical protein